MLGYLRAIGDRRTGEARERMEFETFVIIVLVVVALLTYGMSAGRRASRWRNQRSCVACGAANPMFAQFCRRCGQRLS